MRLLDASCCAGIGLARLEDDQVAQFFLASEGLAFQLHARDGVLLALGDVDGEVDVLLVRGDRHLRRFDVRFEVAAVQVVGLDRFQVAGQLGLGVLVGF